VPRVCRRYLSDRLSRGKVELRPLQRRTNQHDDAESVAKPGEESGVSADKLAITFECHLARTLQ